MTERNYQAEMRELIDRSIPERGEFIASAIAEKVVATLQERDPELLNGWLTERAASFITEYITDIVGRRRRRAATNRKTEARSVFAGLVSESEAAGNTESLERWLDQYYVVDDSFTRRALADMTRQDLAFVESQYEKTIRENLLEKAFITALKRKVPGGKTVKDVLSEEKVRALYNSLVAA